MAKIIGYQLSPVTNEAAGFATACIMEDMVTGKMISSSGGGAYAISKETFDLLTSDQEVRALIRSKLSGHLTHVEMGKL